MRLGVERAVRGLGALVAVASILVADGNAASTAHDAQASPRAALFASLPAVRHHAARKKPRRDGRVRILRAGGDLDSFIASLHPGEIGKLAPGAYGSPSANVDVEQGGTPARPIRLTSLDRRHPATIVTRVVFKPGGNYWTLDHLRLDWDSRGQRFPQVTIGSAHVTLAYDDIQSHNSTICVNAIDDPTWGTARYTKIVYSRIHNCGVRPVTSYSSPGYFAHGIYVVGEHTIIRNNYLYDNSNRGVQLRGSKWAIVEHNTIDGNGSGIVFGDLGASNNTVAYNIISNSGMQCHCNSYGAYSWWGDGGLGSGNSFDHNCLFGNQSGNIELAGGGFSANRNKIANPRFVDRAHHDYALRPGSPCAGDGVQKHG